MKKMFLTALAAIAVAAPAAMAQNVNVSALKSKIEKSDAAANDAKKATKAATWLNRGKAYYAAAQEPVKNLFLDMDEMAVELTNGKPLSTTEETINAMPAKVMHYKFVDIYTQNSKVIGWIITKPVVKNAIDIATDSYVKTIELDPKGAASKVGGELRHVVDYSEEQGKAAFAIQKQEAAAKFFLESFKAQSAPGYAGGKPDYNTLYNAGIAYTIEGSGNGNLEAFPKGVKAFEEAIDNGFVDEDGSIYYYLFHCYYGQREAKPELLENAKQALLKGIAKFPKNDRIIEGLIQLYTTDTDNSDPAELVAIIDEAVAADPKNVDLWFGRGRTFYALKNYDESIVSFTKVTELKPELYEGHFFLGVFYIDKGNQMNTEMSKKTYTSAAESQADLEKINEFYKAAIPAFEHSLEIRPNDLSSIEYLKSLCFRLRDEPGLQAKYEQYNAMFKELKENGAQ